MPQLRSMMKRALTVRGYSPGTHRIYIKAVEDLANYYHRSPDKITEQEISDFLYYLLTERKLANSSCNTFVHGLRFFYRMLKKEDIMPNIEIPRSKEPSKQPDVLTRAEIQRLIEATPSLKQRALFMTAYGAGLRCNEIVKLRVSDIDSDRMVLRVRLGKGGRERRAMLSPTLLHVFRAYWKAYRPDEWLFPGADINQPMSSESPSVYLKRIKKKAGIKKRGGMHGLRHTFATHLLEDGVDLCTIQLLMGHRRISTTAQYIHVSTKHMQSITLPIDHLQLLPAE